jgi:peroxiredoxin
LVAQKLEGFSNPIARKGAKMRSGTVTATGVVLFLFLFFLGMYRSTVQSSADSTPSVLHRKAPPFTLPETSGGQVDLDSFRGRPVLLVFWSMASADCRRELSLINQVAPDYRMKGIGVVAIHLGDVANLKDYFRSNQISMTSLIDADGSVEEDYGVERQHELVLIGNDGRIKQISEAIADEALLRKWMELASGT